MLKKNKKEKLCSFQLALPNLLKKKHYHSCMDGCILFSYFKVGYSCATNTLFDPDPGIANDIRKQRFEWLKFFKEEEFMVTKVSIYVRPVTSNTFSTVDYTLINHGIFHPIIILTTNHKKEEYRYFYCDRVVEEIRFEVLTEELEQEQLLSKACFKVVSNEISKGDGVVSDVISSQTFAQFIEQESAHGYSILSNNCIHFTYHAYCLFVTKHVLSHDTFWSGWTLRQFWSRCNQTLEQQHWDDKYYPLFRDRKTGLSLLSLDSSTPSSSSSSSPSLVHTTANFHTHSGQHLHKHIFRAMI
ncbi:hypothetical protein RFI_16215 [Reticulomyxa filosa]|uniref:PPPDE domain-containing protein n=1 Tax=Reticulomyxa filosa TaxID=46433 RepID=X6N3Y7_RETFI|nr:hypothetical protein RFI_16215 [Reticulomyxa filosa]|eukprot:ETO20990.1 hypothetical protein RFI_16215 [Reticulomyxa filosa]